MTFARRVPRLARALATDARTRTSEFYNRPPGVRELPALRNRAPALAAVGAAGLGAWAAFYAYATNAERLSNSVTVQVLDAARTDADLRAVLGDAVRATPAWWLNGDPWIAGAVRVYDVVGCARC
jgi:cytochrome c oxidase assembly factor 1